MGPLTLEQTKKLSMEWENLLVVHLREKVVSSDLLLSAQMTEELESLQAAVGMSNCCNRFANARKVLESFMNTRSIKFYCNQFTGKIHTYFVQGRTQRQHKPSNIHCAKISIALMNYALSTRQSKGSLSIRATQTIRRCKAKKGRAGKLEVLQQNITSKIKNAYPNHK